MKARFMLAGLAAMLSIALVLPAAGVARSAAPAAPTSDNEVVAYYNFEWGLNPWKGVTDSFYHNVVITQQRGEDGCAGPMFGDHYAQLATVLKAPVDRSFAPPTRFATWTVAGLPVGGKGVRQVTVTWVARLSPEPAGSGTTNAEYNHAVLYVGTKVPVKALDFVYPAKNDLNHGWQTYKYQTYIDLPAIQPVGGTPVYIGLGWDGAGDSMDLDCVSIAITYPPTR